MGYFFLLPMENPKLINETEVRIQAMRVRSAASRVRSYPRSIGIVPIYASPGPAGPACFSSASFFSALISICRK